MALSSSFDYATMTIIMFVLNFGLNTFYLQASFSNMWQCCKDSALSLGWLIHTVYKFNLWKKVRSSRSLRSDNQNLLLLYRSYTVRCGNRRNFRNVPPMMWKDLPVHLPLVCDDVDAFKKMLKTLLFQEVYAWLSSISLQCY